MKTENIKTEYDPEFETYWQDKISALITCKLLDTDVQTADFKVILYNAWLRGYNTGTQNAINKLK